MKKALLLVNLGTPESTDPKDVGKYLTEFLTDKHVIDIPYPLRQFLVRALIVPKRKFASAEKYKTIWTKDGSPLMIHTENLSKKLDKKLESYDVHFAMRYGQPSIKNMMQKLSSYEEITVLPLYPHDTKSSVLTANEEVLKWAPKTAKLDIIPPFYGEDFFIDSLTHKIKEETKDKQTEFYLFSYHGIPQHHLPKACETCTRNCHDSEIIDSCYRAQCYKTSELLASKLKLTSDQYMTSFQSRLGKRPWIKPYTDLVIEDIKKKGIKNIAVLSPSFMSDCLETEQELGMELKEDFEKGSSEYHLDFIPCLNDSEVLVENLSHFLGK